MVEGPQGTLRRWTGIPIEVRVVHGETGDTLTAVGIALADRRTPSEGPSSMSPVPMRLDGAEFRLDVSPTNFGEPRSNLAFVVEPPEGLLVGTDAAVMRRSVRVSPFARALRATVPLRRATEIDIDVRWDDRHRVRGEIRDFTVRIGGRTYDVPPRAPHRVLVPYLLGESAHVRAAVGASVDEVVVPFVGYAPRIAAALRLPRHVPPNVEDDRSGSYRGPSCVAHGCGPSPDLPEGTAVLDMRVLLRDGRPAEGAGVRVRAASNPRADTYTSVDAEGRAYLVQMGAGTYSIEIEATGMVPIKATAELAAGEHPVIHLIEPIGETAEITVVNARGARLPFARVDVYTDHLGLLPGGVQLLDHFTGPDGICRIERVPDQRTAFYARWAGRSGCGFWTPGEPLTITIAEE